MDICQASVSLPRRKSSSHQRPRPRPSLAAPDKKKQDRKRPCLKVSVVGVTGYDRNVLLGPTSPKPNRPAVTPSNTVPSDTRIPSRRVSGRAEFFIEMIISQTEGNYQAFKRGPLKYCRRVELLYSVPKFFLPHPSPSPQGGEGILAVPRQSLGQVAFPSSTGCCPNRFMGLFILLPK
jgi:hypothetical protein